MSDNSYYYQDDPTQPARPASYPPQASRDDKLVVGNFQDAQKRPGRGPYQYSPSQQGAPVQSWQQGAQGGSTMPAPSSPSYPYPGQAAGNFGSAPTPQRPP